MYKSIVIIVLLYFNSYSQERFEIKNIGFSINVPEDWIIIENKEVLENINNYDISKEQKEVFLSSNNSANELVSYVKYNPKEYKGIIPTIKIRTREVKSKNSVSFLKFIENSNLNISKQLHNFVYQEKPKSIFISGKEVFRFVIIFSMFQEEKEYQIISYSYYILKKGYYISVNFIEEYNKENNYDFFQDLINSIELN